MLKDQEKSSALGHTKAGTVAYERFPHTTTSCKGGLCMEVPKHSGFQISMYFFKDEATEPSNLK